MVNVQINITGVRQAVGNIQAVGARARHMRPAFEVIAQHVKNGVLRNFRREGWWPSRWQKSAAAIKRGGRTLTDNSILKNSIHATSSDTYAKVGTDLVYAAIHQFGGRCGRNHATLLPARPFLPVDAEGNLEPGILRRVERTAATWILEGRIA